MSENDPATPEWPDVIRRAISSRLLDVHTALPGRVEAYDPATQLADIKPMIRRTLPAEGTVEETSEDLPVIPAVPVGFVRSGTAFISVPVKVGTTGQLIFNERAIDRFRSLGEDSEPGDNRMHGLSGAFFLPVNLVPRSEVLAEVHPDNIVIGFDGGIQIHLDPSGDRIDLGETGLGADDRVAIAKLVIDELVSAADAAAIAAVPNDGGKVAFETFSSDIGSADVHADKVRAT